MAEQMRVLVVDDNVGRRMSLKRQLAGSEFTVAGEAEFGGEAVYLATQVQADVVVVGLEEPAARPLKTIELLTSMVASTPVVVLSSLSDKEHLRKAMVAGAREFLSYPCGGDEVRTTLLSVVEAEERRRALARDADGAGHTGEIIAVHSGKGGAGKTSVATNLAAALAMDAVQPQKVALVDLDLLLGDVAVTLDLLPERTMADLAPVADKLDPELMRGFLVAHSSGVKVLVAPRQPEEGETVTPALVAKMLQVLALTHDFVVLDEPRSLDDRVVTALDVASLVLLLTTYELPALKSTRVLLEVMRRWRYSEDKLKLVINQANRISGFSPGEAESALDYPIFWKIPSEPSGLCASATGQVIVQTQPNSRLAQNIRDLGVAIGGARLRRQGLLSRLVSPVLAASARLG